MKILVICQYYYPEQFRINDICEALVKRGYEVTVVTGLPNYPEGKVHSEYRWFKKRKENINGVKVLRCWEIGRGHNPFCLALNYFSYMISASIRALFLNGNFDLIYCYEMSPVTQILPAAIYSRRKNKPLLIYCCDIWPEAIKAIIKNENGIIFKMIKFFSKKLYSSGDLISVSSNPFIDYLALEHNLDKNKMIYMPQHAEDDYLSSDFTPEKNGCIDFLFAGNIGTAQDMECIIDACNINRYIPNYKVHIVGNGSYFERSKQLVREKQLDNIFIFHGRHPLNKMPEFYKIADACLLTLKADNLTGLTMPSKLQGYMAAGKPVIGAINGAAQETIRQSNCGICVNASDVTALAEVMKDFIESPNKYKTCGENGRKYFKEYFTKEIFINHLENTFRKLVEA